jgi:hypothetical protein
MNSRTVSLKLPETLYIRLQQAAQATKQSFDAVLLHALRMGSPPDWKDIPPEFQADAAALERLDDTALWRTARQKRSHEDMAYYQQLLDKNADRTISEAESEKLRLLRTESDRFMLLRAHAAALLRWRGYQIPPAENL